MPQTRTLADSIELIVVGAVGLTSRALVEAAPDAELTFPQWRALVVVGGSEDGVRVGHVAERVGITSPATGRLLKRMQQRGLLTLDTDERDRRATLARLTPQGERIRVAIVAYRRRALQSIADGVPAEAQEELTRAAVTISLGFAPFA
jgi:DNA-binding MarR family transcriptional regulator